jgi:hypothetical protein
VIIERLKCVFVHIPKTGGSSVTKILNPKTPFVSVVSDENLFVGWCPKNRMWMQHATMHELNVLYKKNISTYFKFGFVRNPWERAVSDYLWLLRDTPSLMKSESSFLHYLTESGGFKYIFKNKGHKSYRGEHIKTQYDFLYDKVGNKLVDFIGRTEYFEKDLKFVLSKIGFGDVTIPREKKSSRLHYTKYYDEEARAIVDEKYKIDIDTFNYSYGN